MGNPVTDLPYYFFVVKDLPLHAQSSAQLEASPRAHQMGRARLA